MIRFYKQFVLLFCVFYVTKADDLNFLVVGDWGGIPVAPYYTPYEMSVAHVMGKVAENISSKFTLGLGDNFYETGVVNVEDRRFQETFEHVYTAPSLQNPWYFLAGNHDHYGNASAEIAYSNVSTRWNFPNYYYKMSQKYGNTTVDIIMIDTVLLCGNTEPDFAGSQPTGPESRSVAEEQWQFILDSLSESTAKYVLVAGHFPVFSVAEHGPTHCLVDRLLPLLHKFNVSAYLCGHDHNMQHIQYTSAGNLVDYFVIGAGNIVDPSTKHESDIPANSLRYHWANLLSLGAFASVRVGPEQMTIRFIEAPLGTVVYEHSIKPRQ